MLNNTFILIIGKAVDKHNLAETRSGYYIELCLLYVLNGIDKI